MFGVLLVFFIGSYTYYHYDYYSVSSDRFSYSGQRGKPDYKMTFSHSEDGVDFYSVIFSSREDARLFGFVFVPTNGSTYPGMILLPGGGGDKEKEADLALRIARQGFVVLTYDQRGVGQTTAPLNSFSEDNALFLATKEPTHHLVVYDTLKAFDVLTSLKYVLKDSVIVAGESEGGRTAIIATALEPRIKGVITFASGGFFVKGETPFLRSINPDTYIASITPRTVMMIHGDQDDIIPLPIAVSTFSLAKDPKFFFTANGCGHGVCEEMVDIFKKNKNKLLD